MLQAALKKKGKKHIYWGIGFLELNNLQTKHLHYLISIPDSLVSANSQAGKQIQCYACGLPKVHPEYDVIGSYGQKKYNHSCEEMLESQKKNNVIDEAFIRTCPVGVRSCFGATGFYDHKDTDATNDICEY